MKILTLMIAVLLSTQILVADQATSGTASGAEFGSSTRKGQTDPTDKHSWVGSRARGQALQTDKFPRPPEPVSGTASGTMKSKY